MKLVSYHWKGFYENMPDKKTFMTSMDKNKEVISYSRDYRHLHRNLYSYILQVVLILVPIVIGYLFVYNKLSYYVSAFSANILAVITGESVGIQEVDYLPEFGGVYYVTMEGKSPSFMFSLISFFVSLILMIVISKLKTDRKPLIIFINMGLFVHCLYMQFLLFCYLRR